MLMLKACPGVAKLEFPSWIQSWIQSWPNPTVNPTLSGKNVLYINLYFVIVFNDVVRPDFYFNNCLCLLKNNK